MGRLKLKKPPTKTQSSIQTAAQLAMAEYKIRLQARRELAINEEIISLTDQRDMWNENWMWGLFAVVLHRRYHFEADEIVRIMNDVQSLHNEIYDGTLSYEETNQIVLDLARKEVGLDIESEDLKEVKHRCG